MKSGDKVNYDFALNFVLIGDSYVGKTQLMNKFCYGCFKKDNELGAGSDSDDANIQIDNKMFLIRIFSPSGSLRYASTNRLYYKNSVCALFIHDITSRISIINVSD